MVKPVEEVMRTPRVSAVIVTWNSRSVVLDCLTALQASAVRVSCDAVVVDNASIDGTPDLVRDGALWVRVIENDANRGLPAANNQGIAASVGEYVLIANPDTVMRPGALEALVDLLDRHPRAAFAVPRLLHVDGTLQISAGDLPKLSEALLGRQLQRRRRARNGFWWDGWEHDEERRIGRGHEACYLVRRDAIADIGVQDERFFLEWEGIDWTERATALGWEVWFTPRAEVVHVGGVSIRQVPLRWLVTSHRGMYRYFAKRMPIGFRPLLAAAVTARGVAKAIGSRLAIADYERGLGRR